MLPGCIHNTLFCSAFLVIVLVFNLCSAENPSSTLSISSLVERSDRVHDKMTVSQEIQQSTVKISAVLFDMDGTLLYVYSLC